jgi:uncharacterized NAD(P)/FAD-binding protein YdhS
MTTRTVAIIGAGYSGTALALNLLEKAGPAIRIILLERADAFGLGQAYGTANPDHLLNVPAARMSAFATQPNHFVDWLQTQPGVPPGEFKPRKIYGAYIRDLLDQGCRSAAGRLQLVRGDVVEICKGESLTVTLADRRMITADIAVLALGNYQPFDVLPGEAARSPAYRGNPWHPDAIAGLDPDAPVLVVGTGLTMVDTVVTLLDAGHRGPIQALSRRGLAPQRHVPHSAAPLPPLPAYPAAMLGLLRCLKADAAACVAAGGTWQDAMDRFRPSIQTAWQRAGLFDRTQFLRHLRPWWDIHRHRIAGPVADRIDAARSSGQLRITGGRIRAAADDAGGMVVSYAPRGGTGLRSFHAARVINCTGPASDYTRIADPLVRALLAGGLVQPDPLRLGLQVTPDSALVGANGPSTTLFAMGPVTRGAFWEVTSVPDIRQQCDALSTHIAALLHPAPASTANPADQSSAGPIDFMRSNTRLRTDGSVMR